VEFKYIDRGYKGRLVLLAGWATDYRIFSGLDLPYNYLLPVNFSLLDFAPELEESLNKNHLGQISLLGWSLGGFLAADFCRRFPERVKELFLLGMRRQYPKDALRGINLKLAKNKKAWLYKFYQSIFAKADTRAWDQFKQSLWPDYSRSLGLEDLVLGLEYLSRAELNPQALGGIKKIRVFHGEEDLVVPLAESEALKSCLPHAEFFRLKNAGHACFFSPEFTKGFSHE
jgi:pimeloyl-ACP methyl ester carboxylesterase